MLFGLKGALDDRGASLILQTPRAFWVVRGLVLALLVPLLLIFLVGLLAGVDILAVGAEEPGVFTGLGALLFFGVGGPSFLVGALHLLRSSSRSAQSRVEIDLEAREIRPTGGPAVPFDQLRGLVLRKPNPLLKWVAIEADLGGAATAAADDPSPYRAPRGGASLRLLGNLNELELGGARKLMQQLADRMGVEAMDRSPSLLGGGGESGAGAGRIGHAATYFPLQGIFFFASLFFLFARKDDPVGQFHARQSLTLLVFEMVAIFGTIIVAVPFLFLGEILGKGDGEPHPVGLGILVVGLLGVTGLRMMLRFVATYKAWRGKSWLMPGVGRISARWLPPADPA